MNNRFWPTDLIGVLEEDEPDVPYNKQAIFINNQESLQFQIRLISQPPESFPNVKQITCFATYLEEDWGFEDNQMLSDDERKQNLRDFLSESLIVFNPERKLLYNHSEVYNAKNIRLIPKSDSYTPNVSLLPFPIFSEKTHKLTLLEFIQRLQSRKFVGRIENISNELNDTPTYVIWKEDDENYIVFGEFDKHQYAHGGFNLSVRDQLKRINFEKSWLDDTYIDQKQIPDLMFITLENYKKIVDAMEKAEFCNPIWIVEAEPREIKTALPELAAAEKNEQEIEQVENFLPLLEKADEKNEPSAPAPITILPNMEENAEYKFLERFIATTQELGLAYSEKDLINFHTAMKSCNLVILAGMSGTGKSKLVTAYSRALGLYSEQFTFISVRPSWTDDADLIGYADTLNMVYRPGDSGLINVLRRAEQDEDKLFIICFDEMNLARVEHYFSQFLSILEQEPGQRVLHLYNEELANRLYNSAQYPPTITIKENVMFVGTVNLDESTYHFSDKVLDRANVIQLEVLPFHSLNAVDEKKKIVHLREKAISYEGFESFKNKKDSMDLTEPELSFLWDLHTELQKVNRQIGIGPRIVRQIDKYLKNLPETPILDRKEAFDIQIVQRILTKIRGSEDQLQPFIGKYDRINHNVTESTFLNLIERYKGYSDFEKTIEVIFQKARELKLNGYSI